MFRTIEDVDRAFFPDVVREREERERKAAREQAREEAFRLACERCRHGCGVMPCGGCYVECLREVGA